MLTKPRELYDLPPQSLFLLNVLYSISHQSSLFPTISFFLFLITFFYCLVPSVTPGEGREGGGLVEESFDVFDTSFERSIVYTDGNNGPHCRGFSLIAAPAGEG